MANVTQFETGGQSFSLKDIAGRKGLIGSEYVDFLNGHYVEDSSATGDYADVDTFPVNRAVLCSSVTSAHVAHLPGTPFEGYIITINYQGKEGNNNKEFTVQIAQTIRKPEANKIYIRAKYASWGAWRDVGNVDTLASDVATLKNGAMQLDPGLWTSSNIAGTKYADCNTLSPGSIVFYYSASGLLHAPVANFTGYVTTINYHGYDGGQTDRDFSVQFAQSCGNGQNAFYYRANYADWTAWVSISEEFALSMQTYNGFFTNGNLPQFPEYANCNTIPNNTIALYSSASDLLNRPSGFYSGYITTVHYRGKTVAGNQQFTVQYAHALSGTTNDIYFRVKYADWSAWKKVGVDTSFIATNAYRGLKNFTVLGDSISVSLSYPTMSPSYTVKSWAAIMADSMNATATIYAQGGRTTAAMLASSDYPTAKANSGNNQFAIIALGINDANGSVASETFKSNYTQLISGMLEHHKFVFCCTIPDGLKGSERAQYNADIKTVASGFANAFVVDVDAYSAEIAPLCHLGHMSSVCYAALASFIAKSIDDTIAANTYFTQGVIDQ